MNAPFWPFLAAEVCRDTAEGGLFPAPLEAASLPLIPALVLVLAFALALGGRAGAPWRAIALPLAAAALVIASLLLLYAAAGVTPGATGAIAIGNFSAYLALSLPLLLAAPLAALWQRPRTAALLSTLATLWLGLHALGWLVVTAATRVCA